MSQPRSYANKVIESKAALNLKSLKSDKTEFKQWNERLVNVFSAHRPHARDFFVKLKKRLDFMLFKLLFVALDASPRHRRDPGPHPLKVKLDPLRDIQGAREEPEGMPGGPGDLQTARGGGSLAVLCFRVRPGLPPGSSLASLEDPQGIYF